MNPELPQVRASTEAMPQIPGGAEYFPDGSVRTPELRPTTPERPAPSPVEQPTQPSQVAPATAPVIPAPQAPLIGPSTDTSIVAGAPAIAGDDDLIEKEWVEKAKKIIALTKGNPYEQAKAISALQADYLKKRYNRELGESTT